MPPIEVVQKNIKKHHFSFNLYRTEIKTYFKTLFGIATFSFHSFIHCFKTTKIVPFLSLIEIT